MAKAKDLTPKRQLFAEKIIAGLNPSEAYRAAGYSCARMSDNAVAVEAQKLLANPNISLMIEQGRKAAAEAVQWTLDKAVERTLRVKDQAYDEIDRYGFVEKSPGPKAFFDSIDRLNKYTGVEREIDAPDGELGFPVIDTASVIPGCYADEWRAIMRHDFGEFVNESGRGSVKSSMFSLAGPMIMLKFPTACGVAFRRVNNTLRDSVYASIIQAITRAGMEHLFEWGVSPMHITLRATGQVILFRGLDDEDKAKSLTLQNPEHKIMFAFWEEFDQQRGMRSVRKVEQTIKRGVDRFWTFRAFNTPTNENHWAHAYALQREESGEAWVGRQNYLDVPREFLGEEFYADAEALKEIDPEAYENEYLGKCTGRKGKVFLNLERREITQEERDGFKWIRCGIDWGFVTDPWVFLQLAYDRKTKTVYILQEDYALRLSDEQTAKRVKKRLSEVAENGESAFYPRAPRNRLYADIAEQKAIANYRACGLDCVGAKKWQGSVEQGLRWMQTRTRIVIDKRCALAWHEFSAYDYETDPDGNVIEDAYPDKDNHTIDAARYTLSTLIANKKEV